MTGRRNCESAPDAPTYFKLCTYGFYDNVCVSLMQKNYCTLQVSPIPNKVSDNHLPYNSEQQILYIYWT